MSFDSQYAWVVFCKNHKFHKRQNLFFGHKIPLGEADAFLPPPIWTVVSTSAVTTAARSMPISSRK
jgi:hypothetical protein